MAQKLDQDELVSFRELLISNTIQLDTVSRLLIEKGIITDEEFFTKLKEVQIEGKKRMSVEDFLRGYKWPED